jgi:hypothetical protein
MPHLGKTSAVREAKTMRYREVLGQKSSKTLDSGIKSSRTCLVGSLGALLRAEDGQFRLLHHLKHGTAPHPDYDHHCTTSFFSKSTHFTHFAHFAKNLYIRVCFQNEQNLPTQIKIKLVHSKEINVGR